MLFVRFALGTESYALPASDVVEIVPMVELRFQPHSPEPLAGILNYRGRCVPVIDLRRLVEGKPSVRALSTRILLVGYDGGRKLLGLMVEEALDTFSCEEKEFHETGLRNAEARYLAGMRLLNGASIQRLIVDEIVQPELRLALFGGEEAKA